MRSYVFIEQDATLMEFAQPLWLWLLLLVPLVGLHAWRAARRRRGGLRFSDVGPARSAPRTWRTRLEWLPAALRMGALALGIVALARPQIANTTRTRSAEGIDIMLVLDTSTSMQAEDFEPNRFEAAREVAGDFVRSRLTDRVGLVVFAAKAYTQTPLTLDYDFLLRMMNEVEVGIIEDGTAIGTAIAMAVGRLTDAGEALSAGSTPSNEAGANGASDDGASDGTSSKVAVVLTDGQNNRGEVDPVTAAELAEAMGVRVYTIGVGTRDGAPYPVSNPFYSGQRRIASARIDEEMLQEVAAKTGGRYFRATSKEGLRTVYDEIGEMEKTKIQERVYTDREERYALFLWPAFGLLFLEVLLSTTSLRRFP